MRRQSLFKVVLLINLVYLANINGQTKPEKQTVESNTVELDLCYDFSIPGNTSKIKFVVALPRTIPDRQKIWIKYSPKPSKVFLENGNHYAEFILTSPEKQFKVQITVKGELFQYDLVTSRKKKEKKPSKDPEFKNFLKHEKYVEKDDPLIQQIAKNIKGQTEIDKVKNIYNYVIDNMEYGGFTKEALGAVKAAQQKKGDCTEYSDLFAALCRAKNIPTRVVSGYTTQFNNTPKHNWVEVYLKEYGWVPFDPTRGDVKNSSAQTTAFDTMKPIYIYFSHTRNDEILYNNLFWGYWRWGDQITVEDSIKFK